MPSNTIGGKDVNINLKPEKSSVRIKLRIILLIRTGNTSQETIKKSFRNKDNVKIEENSIPQEIAGSTIVYEDKDVDGYTIFDKMFEVDENSPKSMENMSKYIDNYIKGFEIRDDVDVIFPCFFVPNLSNNATIPKLFFHSYPPEFLLMENKNNHNKIDVKKGFIYFFEFAKVESLQTTHESKIKEVTQSSPNLNSSLVQLFAIICHYTYFYLDFIEQKDWNVFKRKLLDKDKIEKYVENYNKPKEQNSIVSKVAKFICLSLMIPIKVMKYTIEYLLSLNYDGNLKNRIYGRIMEVIEITSPNKTIDEKVKIISDVLENCKGEPVNIFDFYRICNYWEYLNNYELMNCCLNLEIEDIDKEIVSGYGGILFKKYKHSVNCTINHDSGQKNEFECYIYCLKGTDFDSLGRDWLFTNILQGLTGYSLQHQIAVENAKKISKEKDGILWFTGHSLGGGLASAATIATEESKCVTFNAAGLNIIGVKVNQLINNKRSVFCPSKCWDRVYPYRIQGEVLDTAQKSVFRLLTLGTYERGYGKKTVEYKKDINCMKRHGINNFLIKEIMDNLKPFDCLAEYSPDEKKGIDVKFISKNTISVSQL